MIIKNLNETIARQQQENDDLKVETAWLRQKLFGSSSERRAAPVPGQMGLFDGEEEKPPELIEPEVVPLPKKSRKKKPTLKERFENLPTKQVPVDTLSDEDKICSICGTQMVPIGTEIIRTEIVYTRPKPERIEYIATTYGCPQCKDTEEPQSIKDNGRPPFIEGSYVSESLLSLIAYQKYGLYLPLYRREKDFMQLNAPISRSTMAKNLITAAREYLQPMYDLFHRKLLCRRFLMMDETPVQVLKEDDRRAQTKSYFWVIRTGEDGLNPIILYNYTPTRAGENAGRFLNGIPPGFYLMADGYQGSVRGFLYCEKLFAYERSYREKGLGYKQIYTRRLKDEKPVIEGFLAWLKQADPGSNGKLKKAITYIRNREDCLMTCLEDGRCSFSDNLSENSIRPVTAGRKNRLFSDTPEGAQANTRYLTIVEMAKAHGLDLYKYLNFLFEQRPDKDMSDEELEKPAPWNERVKELCSIK